MKVHDLLGAALLASCAATPAPNLNAGGYVAIELYGAEEITLIVYNHGQAHAELCQINENPVWIEYRNGDEIVTFSTPARGECAVIPPANEIRVKGTSFNPQISSNFSYRMLRISADP